MSWGSWGPGMAAVVISPAHTCLGLWILWDQSLLIQSSQKFCKLSSFLLSFLNSRFECFLFYKAFSSVQFSHSVVSDSLWPHGLRHARPPCPSSIPRDYSNSCPLSWWIHPTISSCRPLLLLPSIFPSIRVFSNESFLHIRWPKYWRFSFNISPSNEYSGLISFRMNCLDLLAVQGTLKSLLQYHSSKASILQAQLSLYSNSHIHTWPQEKPQIWLDGPLLAK